MYRTRGMISFTILCMLASYSACSKSTNSKGDVEVPALTGDCSSGACVQGQFETSYQRFAVITGEGVNLRSKPSVTARVVSQLPVTRKVTVLFVKPEEATIGGKKGRWAFARDTADLGQSGWIFDHFIGYTASFKKTAKWRFREIRVILGSRLAVYRCTPDGRFQLTQTEKKKQKITAAGDILQCNNVLWLKKDTPDDYPAFFHIMQNGNLELPDQYKDKRGIVLTNR